MNRSILIVICDFLLLMLLASSRLDQLPSLENGGKSLPVQQYQSAPQAATAAPAVNARNARTADVLDSMRSSLEEEHGSREKLATALSQAQEALRSQQQLAAERQQQLTRAEADIRQKEEEARRIEQSRQALAASFQQTQTNLAQIQRQLDATSLEARLSQQRLSSVEQQYAGAQSNVVNLAKQLSSSSTEARLARERLSKIESDLHARQAEAEQARQRIQEVEKMRLNAEVERERIAGQLKVAETEHKMTEQQLASAKGQIETVQKEKAEIQKVATELAQGVVQFADKQGELTKEIRENRPLTANTIFAEFLTNRVNTDFRANRSGILGRTISRDTQARTILVNDGVQTFAIYHVNDTPFRIEEFGKDLERFIVHLYRGDVILPLERILFLSIDPRIVVAPVTEDQAKKLGVRVYKTVADPFRFQDALIVGADEGYFGECKFKLDPANRGYLKMDRSALGKLVGKFNPSRGDLVFAKSGELIGMMVNKEYCAQLTSFVSSSTIPTGANLDSQAIGTRLSIMDEQIHELPPELQ
jgi:hypothetical protein